VGEGVEGLAGQHRRADHRHPGPVPVLADQGAALVRHRGQHVGDRPTAQTPGDVASPGAAQLRCGSPSPLVGHRLGHDGQNYRKHGWVLAGCIEGVAGAGGGEPAGQERA
jgi:hypothetical protein